MRNLILSTLSTFALLIYPLSLSAQNTFSVSADVNGTAGDQAVTSLNASADQVVAIQIFGNNIQNANGLAVRFEYNSGQVTYEGFDVGSVLPNAQALPEHGTNPTFIQIGIVSFGGQAAANSGLFGTIRFRTTAAFSGTAIQLVRAELGRGGQFETIMPNIRIALQGAPTPANFSLSLDGDSSAGDQAVTSLNVSADEMVAIEIFGKDILNANGISIRFEYDASQVTYDGFDVGSVLPSAQALPEQGTNPTFVEIGIVSFGGQATANSGLFGTIRFRTTAAFSGTAIRLVRAELGRGGQIASATMDVRVALQLSVSTAPSPDFNGDGIVNIADLVLFVNFYGTSRGDTGYDAKYDLNSDGEIGILDLRIFVNDFLEPVPLPPDNGGSPDLIVESPSVSHSTLTTGQSFTLRATVRNQGNGQAAATTLRYYQSTNTTISPSDTRVGSNAVGSLNASSSSIDSISLNAPSSAGTYYYGACVSSVSGESSTTNNCSRAVRVTVSSGSDTVTIPDTNLRAVIADSLGKASDASITRAEMATLTRLDAPNSNISDLTGLEFATNLQRLKLGSEWVSGRGYVNSNEISDLSPLSNLTNLTYLDLSSNSISDISALANLTNLTTLDLVWNDSISDISALANLTNLTILILGDAVSGFSNNISDISALANLTNLTRLDLFGNSISDISALANLTNLTTLRLFVNSISDITPLSNLTKLTYLGLSSNSISDISALANLTNLTTLDLSYNSISDISALANLTNLTTLRLSRNSISDISALANLINLTDLYLRYNSISDISPLVSNTGLGSGDEMDVRNNPLSATSINTHIPALQGRGVTVEFDSGGGGSPDLIVDSPSVSDSTLTSGQAFTLSATVRNQGTGSSASTTLRYYRSSNSTISRSDTEVGTDSVSGLSASSTSAESISLNAPSSAGTYYYGACVASVSGESNTGNNCSDGVRVTVSSGSGGGGGGGGTNTVPSEPSLNAWINASGSESQRLLDQATICRAGLEFPRDTFCVNTQQTILVGHLDSGEGLVIRGSFISRAGGDIRLSGIVLERRGDVRVLTQFNP